MIKCTNPESRIYETLKAPIAGKVLDVSELNKHGNYFPSRLTAGFSCYIGLNSENIGE